MKAKFALLVVTILSANLVYAQSFIPDGEGYVSDPAFHKFIKTRGYQLVSAFDTLQKKPLLFVARVIQNGKWLFIDNTGKIITPKEPAFEPYVPNANYNGSDDIVISTYNAEVKSGYKLIEANGKFGFYLFAIQNKRHSANSGYR